MKSGKEQDPIWCAIYGAEVSRYIGERYAEGRSLDDEMMRRAHDEAEAAADWNAETRREVATELARLNAVGIEFADDAREENQ